MIETANALPNRDLLRLSRSVPLVVLPRVQLALQHQLRSLTLAARAHEWDDVLQEGNQSLGGHTPNKGRAVRLAMTGRGIDDIARPLSLKRVYYLSVGVRQLGEATLVAPAPRDGYGPLAFEHPSEPRGVNRIDRRALRNSPKAFSIPLFAQALTPRGHCCAGIGAAGVQIFVRHNCFDSTDGDQMRTPRQFMANIVLPGGKTVSEEVRPRIAQAYLTRTVQPLLPDYSTPGDPQ